MTGFRAIRTAGRLSRRRTLVSAFVAAGAVGALSAAVAFACVPATSMGFDSANYQYKAGARVGVTATGFHPNAEYKMTLTPPSGGETPVGAGADGTPVKADGAGGISDSFVLPATAAVGDYIVKVQTTATNANGTSQTRVARETFSVVADAPPAPVAPPASPAPLAPAVPAPGIGTSFLTGTSGNDTITGTPFADVISCGAGNDTVRGGGGNDVIKCGAGNDRISGGAGKDIVFAGSGNDKASGGAGNDTLRGNAGSDTLRGDAGTDRLLGGSGSDRLYRDSKDKLSGGAGRDSTVAVK